MHKATPSHPQDGGQFSRKGSNFGEGSRPPASRPGTSSAATAAKKGSLDIPRPFYDTISALDVSVAPIPPLLTFNIFGRGSRAPAARPGTSSGASTAKKISLDIPRPSFDSVLPLDTSVSAIAPRRPSFSSTSKSPHSKLKGGRPSTADKTATLSPETWPLPARSKSARHPVASRSTDQRQSLSQPLTDISAQFQGTKSRPTNRLSVSSTAPYSKMLATSYSRDNKPGNMYHVGAFAGGAMVPTLAPGPLSPTLETITYQHIQEMASKRISTLVYLRKAHEGRVYWFNTLLFNKPDLARMPYFDTRRLGRRATNYLLLGLSLPTILDLNSSTPVDFLRTLNALLAEFEAFQQIHPPDGSTSSSLSRARLPQMFKRATVTGAKGRRTSSAADIGLPMGNDQSDMKSINGSMGSANGSSITSFPTSDSDLLPGEEYTYLLTPSLPFDPDFYETFATLCDVLIDCYTRLLGLIPSPRECSPQIAEIFTKADGRIRKIIVQGVVKEFEETSRGGVKSEVAGVGKVVLGGLM